MLLRNLQVSTPELLFVGALGGIGSNLYWMGMTPEVTTSSHSEDRNKETGYFFSMPALASILSPLAGLSSTPFLFSREHHEGLEIDIKSFLRDTEKIDFAKSTLKGINSIGKKVLWPLHLPLIIESSLSIGGAGSILALGSTLTSIFIGRITSEENRSKVITGGTILAAASYILMSQVTNPITALAVSGLNGLSYTAATNQSTARSWTTQKKRN
jgi:MFS family permease